MRWERLRRYVLDRDGWRCRECGKAGLLEVHHVQPIRDGGAAWDADNLRTLCRGCHIATCTGDRRGRAHAAGAAWWTRC